jgi:hypothetical protein
MLDFSSVIHQHRQPTAIIHSVHLDKSSANSSDKHNMADFLNAFEAFLSGGGGDKGASPPEPDGESTSSEAVEPEVPATGDTSSPDSMSPPPLNDACLPAAAVDGALEGRAVKMPPDKLSSPPPAKSCSPHSSSPSLEVVKRVSPPPPSVQLEVPSARPESGTHCDRTAAAGDHSKKTGGESEGSVKAAPLPVSKPFVPPIKPIVPPIKLRKVDSSDVVYSRKKNNGWILFFSKNFDMKFSFPCHFVMNDKCCRSPPPPIPHIPIKPIKVIIDGYFHLYGGGGGVH